MRKAEMARFVDRFTIGYVRVYPHPIQRVWRAVSRPEGITAWFWTAKFEPRLGALYEFGEPDSGMDGLITAFEPPRLIEFGGPSCHGPEGYIRIALETVAEGTRLTFVQHSQPGFWTSDWPIDPPDLEEGPGLPWRPGTLSGWHSALDCLGELLEGRTPAHHSSQEGPLFETYREHMRSIPAS